MSRLCVPFVAFVCGLLLSAGCSFDSSGLAASGRYTTVPMNVLRCPAVVQPLALSLSSSPHARAVFL